MTDPTELSLERAQDVALVSAAITASGLSASAFARDILVRLPRQIFRMLAGEVPLSPLVTDKCRSVVAGRVCETCGKPDPTRWKSLPATPARKPKTLEFICGECGYTGPCECGMTNVPRCPECGWEDVQDDDDAPTPPARKILDPSPNEVTIIDLRNR